MADERQILQPSAQMQVSFAHEVPIPEKTTYGALMHSAGEVLGFFGSIPCCFCCPNPYKNIEQGYVGLVSRYGRFYKAVDPGLVSINPISESLRRADVKIQIDAIGSTPIMTKDNVNIFIDSVVYWHIVDVYLATFGVSNVRQALIERTQTTLRATLGSRSLQDCIENRDSIAHMIQEIISEPAKNWGVKVETILIKDLQVSSDLQSALSMAATQRRAGEAKVIQAQAEVDSAKLMREASEILNTPAAMQIRYLETMQQMAKSSGTKVIFMPLQSDQSANTVGIGGVTGGGGKGMSLTDMTVYEQLADKSR